MSEMTSIRWPSDEYDAIEAWRASQRPIPPRGEAIRELVREGLEAKERKAKERKRQC